MRKLIFVMSILLLSALPAFAQTPNPDGGKIIIRAKGTVCKGEYPIMELWMGEQKLKRWINIGPSYQDYSFTYPGPITHKIRVQFENECYNADITPNEQRSLTIDYVFIEGIKYETEAYNTYSYGASISGGCQEGFKQADTLVCQGGYFQYNNQVYTTPPRQTSSATFPLKLGKSEFELGVNPFGDAWKYKTAFNPDIPVAFATCDYDQGPRYGDGTFGRTDLNHEEYSFLAKLNSPYVFFDCPSLGENPNIRPLQKYRTISTTLKSRRSDTKVLVYYSITKGVFNNLSQFKEEWFVHRKGMPPTKENRLEHIQFAYLMDVTNPEYQQFIVDYMAQLIDQYQLDGDWDDYIGLKYPPCKCELQDIPDSIRDNWAQEVVSYFKKFKSKYPDKLLIYNFFHISDPFSNSGFDTGSYLNYHQQLLQYADGVWFEDVNNVINFGFSKDGPDFNLVKQLLDMTQSLNKYVFFTVNTSQGGTGTIIDEGYTQTSIEKQQGLARYYLAFYLSFFRGEKTPLILYTSTPWAQSFTSAAYFTDWDLKIGKSKGDAQEVSNRIFKRIFDNAEVWWNNSDSVYHVNFSQDIYTADGIRVTNYDLPAKSGMIFTTFPKQVALLGDINGDSKVDIFDYNILITNFGQTNCGNPADIDGNCKVDIFDYNILVTNFGR